MSKNQINAYFKNRFELQWSGLIRSYELNIKNRFIFLRFWKKNNNKWPEMFRNSININIINQNAVNITKFVYVSYLKKIIRNQMARDVARNAINIDIIINRFIIRILNQAFIINNRLQ